MNDEPQCEACGKRPEVYGSSWCAHCWETIPEYTKNRIITMREALNKIAFNPRFKKAWMKEKAEKALKMPRRAHNGS